jgi:hypothetical protein
MSRIKHYPVFASQRLTYVLIYLIHYCSSMVCSRFVLDLFPVVCSSPCLSDAAMSALRDLVYPRRLRAHLAGLSALHNGSASQGSGPDRSMADFF